MDLIDSKITSLCYSISRLLQPKNNLNIFHIPNLCIFEDSHHHVVGFPYSLTVENSSGHDFPSCDDSSYLSLDNDDTVHCHCDCSGDFSPSPPHFDSTTPPYSDMTWTEVNVVGL